MKRKTPIKHEVKKHLRKSKTYAFGSRNIVQVRSYIRGKGQKTVSKLSNPTLTKPKGYTVKFTYPDKTTEEIHVIATNYHRALDEAFEEKTNKNTPIEITVIDPSIGEIIHIVGSKALEYGKKAVTKGWEFAKTEAKRATSDWYAKQLVEQAYSPNVGTRTIARSKLRNDYPEVWNVMDISRS